MKEPYIKRVGTRGKISIWIVDGTYVRKNLDEEFTNSGQHFRFKVIPEYEIWLDKERTPNERRFLIDEALIEWKLMKEGESYDKAETIADMYQAAERAKTNDNEKISKVHIKKLGETTNGLSIWLVDGRIVRSDFFIDFTEGGHDLVYKFVPHNEVWVDDDLETKEIPYLLIHELHERELMAKGLTYHEAHVRASRLDWKARDNMIDAKETLKNLGFVYDEK